MKLIYAKEDFAIMRIKSGYSVATLADELGISKQALHAFERRANGISPINAKKVMELFDLMFDDLFVIVER